MQYVYFDFDGTIADSFMLGVEVADLLSDKYKYSKIDMSKMDYYKSLTAQQLVKEFKIPFSKMFFLAPRFKSELLKRIDLLKPFDGINEVLEKLSKNYSIGILTSNSEENVLAFLKNYNLSQYISDIQSLRHLFGKHKSLRTIMKKNNISKNEIIYIGDETRDIEAANWVKISSIAVTWGFNTIEILKHHKPTYIAQKPNQIIEYVDEFYSNN